MVKALFAMQTDAAISQGNSGGPLLDSSARLVGINVSSFTRLGTGRSSGVNFALPVDAVMSIAPNLIVSGTNRRAG
jgi:S1-C subfamily serine protease